VGGLDEDVRTLKNDCVRKIDIKFNVNEEVRRISQNSHMDMISFIKMSYKR
jgi:hypothetical protein